MNVITFVRSKIPDHQCSCATVGIFFLYLLIGLMMAAVIAKACSWVCLSALGLSTFAFLDADITVCTFMSFVYLHELSVVDPLEHNNYYLYSVS